MVALNRRLIPAEVRYDDEVRAGLAAILERLWSAAAPAGEPRPRMTTERHGGTTTRSLRGA